jgi:hypothetical protein
VNFGDRTQEFEFEPFDALHACVEQAADYGLETGSEPFPGKLLTWMGYSV